MKDRSRRSGDVELLNCYGIGRDKLLWLPKVPRMVPLFSPLLITNSEQMDCRSENAHQRPLRVVEEADVHFHFCSVYFRKLPQSGRNNSGKTIVSHVNNLEPGGEISE